jgi:hypothetical protein
LTKKLGEILLERGVITPTQLKKALDAQLIFGGRVGTNLLELGYLDEESLAQALEQQQSAEVAGPGSFRSIPAHVIRSLPLSLVKRHKVVPLAVEEHSIRVALSDPNDLVILDEIAFVTGKQVKALVAPEARLLEAMESYYGISRPTRFVTLSDEVRRQMAAPPGDEDSGDVHPARPHAVEIGRPVTPESEMVVGAVETAHEEEKPVEEREAAAHTLEVLREERAREERAHAEALRTQPPPGMEEASERLALIETRDEIGDILLDFAAPRFRRVGLFILQKGRTLGWNGRGEGIEHDRVRAVQIPRDLPSVFDALGGGSGYYLGEVEDLPGNELLVQAMGGEQPEVAFVIPVPFQDRHIAALYGDCSAARMGSLDVRNLRTLVRKAGLAMEMLLLKHRILM